MSTSVVPMQRVASLAGEPCPGITLVGCPAPKGSDIATATNATRSASAASAAPRSPRSTSPESPPKPSGTCSPATNPSHHSRSNLESEESTASTHAAKPRPRPRLRERVRLASPGARSSSVVSVTRCGPARSVLSRRAPSALEAWAVATPECRADPAIVEKASCSLRTDRRRLTRGRASLSLRAGAPRVTRFRRGDGRWGESAERDSQHGRQGERSYGIARACIAMGVGRHRPSASQAVTKVGELGHIRDAKSCRLRGAAARGEGRDVPRQRPAEGTSPPPQVDIKRATP